MQTLPKTHFRGRSKTVLFIATVKLNVLSVCLQLIHIKAASNLVAKTKAMRVVLSSFLEIDVQSSKSSLTAPC